MNKSDIEKILVQFGVNKSLKGFSMFADLILLILEDFDNNPYKKKYKISDYFYKISVMYDVNIHNISANIRTAVTTSNIYGDGLTPKNIIDMILKKKKRGN